MQKRKAKKTRLSVSLTVPQKSALERFAATNDVSLARVTQQAVKEFLQNHKGRSLPLFERPAPKG